MTKVPNHAFIKRTRIAALRLTNGNTALARWIGKGSSSLAQYKLLAPLLAAGATERQFDIGGSQRRVA
jgi:hypothetical protein